MALGNWDPSDNLTTLQDRINRLFNDAFPRSIDPDEDMADCNWRPQVDIYETQNGVTLIVDLPGVDKTDVAVEIKENILTIRGRRVKAADVDEEHYYRRERCCGKFQRAFAMRSLVPPNAIKASFKNGVLKIELPRPEQEKLKPVTVDIY